MKSKLTKGAIVTLLLLTMLTVTFSQSAHALQNEPGSDGILDHRYVIDANKNDSYPLTVAWMASLEWDIVLTATVEQYWDISRFGVRIGSTDGFDTAFDAVDPPAPVSGVVSYFWYPSNPSSPVDLRKLSTSMIPPSDNMTWTYKVRPVGIDGTVVMNWTAEAVAAIMPEFNVLLLDSAGTVVADMRNVTQYSFTAESYTTYTFTFQVFIGHGSDAWDITGPTVWVPDGKCDMRDVGLVALLFGSAEGDGTYDARADITGPTYLEEDGKIDMRDVGLVASHFGETYP